jgi:hypothetical protein
VEALVGDGSAFGLEVDFVRQPSADGSADAVRRALAAGAVVPAVVSAADTVYAAGDVRRFLDVVGEADGGLAVRRDPPPGSGRSAVRIRAGLVERVFDDDPANPLSAAPLWVLGRAVTPFLEGLPGPPYELGLAVQRAIDAGFRIAGVEIGRTRDLTDPFDLVEGNFPYLGAL